MNKITDTDYKKWILELKSKIRSTQIKAAMAVNSALIEFYWDLGKMIAEKQTVWGSKLIEQIANDLKAEFPDMEGLSSSNLKYCRRFYLFYQTQIGQQPVDQFEKQLFTKIPWGHNILIFTKSKDILEAQFYIQKTIENGWSRDILSLQIKSELFSRQGKSITNFSRTLPTNDSDLANQLLKDPYNFDFLTLTESYRERE
jgi:predicted nuclease of restriction endonuclease-like (RecB) superfamily